MNQPTLTQSIQIECMDEIFDTTKLAYEVMRNYIDDYQDKVPEISRTNELFRMIHTLKALILWMKFDNAAKLFMIIEDVLYMIRENRIHYSKSLNDWLMEAHNEFKIFYEIVCAEASMDELLNFEFKLERYDNHEKPSYTQKLETMSVLYVEDDEAIQAPLAKYLKRRVKEVILASDGIDGIEKFKLYSPDIIITDINMPRMHGLKMSGEIRKISPSIPIILTSAYNDKPFQYQANHLGINGYLIKPFDFEDLEMELACCYLKEN